MRRSPVGAFVGVLVAGGLLAAGLGLRPAAATTGGPDGGPALDVAEATLAAALRCTDPAGAPGAKRPVLLVHGTGLTPAQSWDWNYGEVLPKLGYPTCTVALPQSALGDIQVASEYVVHAVDTMAQRWGSRVDVIGHSQGGIEPRWALRWWPGLRMKVDHYIGLASPNHGIYAADACAASGNCWAAVWQMAQGSRFMTALNSAGEAPGPTSYTNIYSLTDDLVQPALPDPTSALGGGANVSNIAVQSVCPGRYVNHGGLLADAVVFALVTDALGRQGPADPADVPVTVCSQAFIPGISPVAAVTGNAGVYTSAAQAFKDQPGVNREPPLQPYAQQP